MKRLLTFFILGISFSSVFAQTRLDQATIDEYLKIQSEFRENLCTPGTEENYKKLLNEYIGDGNYLPTLLDEKVDFSAIKSIIPLIDSKINWIKKQKDLLLKKENFNREIEIVKRIKSNVEKILILKNEYYINKSNLEKKITSARDLFNLVITDFKALEETGSFLLSFKFPINHLALRYEYEKVKDVRTVQGRNRANLIFFFRKVVQDGTLDKLSRSDAHFRASFDSLYTSLHRPLRSKEEYFFSDSERVDLNYFFRNIDTVLEEGPQNMLGKFDEWESRTVRTREFYLSLFDNKKIKVGHDSSLEYVTSLLESRARALYNLKEFSLKKMSSSYEFWSKKSELFQSLYVLETILYGEVGSHDENVGFFRQDVSAVVLNRLLDQRFNQFGLKDPMLKFLGTKIEHTKYPWLNLFFKEGEFSFTYFYIPGNVHIYCPDNTPYGKFLRKENLKIAINALSNKRSDFSGVRYYSRASMFGRIPMDTIWAGYKSIPEAPGIEILKNRKKLLKMYQNQNFKYHYSFKTSEGLGYDVIEIDSKTVVVSQNKEKIFYTYRNPHLFKFFSSLN